MAKKRKSSSKKHRFSPDHVAAPAQASSAALAPSQSSASASAPAALAVGFATAHEVKRDVGRLLILATGFVALLIILWVLFTHTGLGPDTYKAVKL